MAAKKTRTRTRTRAEETAKTKAFGGGGGSRGSSPIRCIIFDLGNVLVKNDPLRACKRFSRHCPLPADEIGWFAPKSAHKLMDTGKLTKKELYRLAVRNLGLRGISQRQFEEWYGDIFTDNKPVQVLARQLARRYQLVLLSNTDPIHFAHIRKQFPIVGIFRSHVLSYKVGYVKPDSRIYKVALRKAGCRPQECVFIDDTLKNVAAARKLGMHGVRYTSAVQLKSALKKFGVAV